MSYVERELWTHQKVAIEAARNKDYFAFLFDCGVGKTATCIHVLRSKYASAERLLPTLIVAPVIVLENWKSEWSKFSLIPNEKICCLLGTAELRLTQFRKYREMFGSGFIAIVNYEMLVSSDKLLKELLDWRPECLVIDESQRIKTPSSKRTKAVMKLARGAKYRYLLTGTPILNTPLDIFSQWMALDLGKAFGKNFFIFRAKYFYDKNASFSKRTGFPCWQIRSESQKEINDLITPNLMRARKEDCLDLPPLVKQRVMIDLSVDQRRHYNNMRDHLITYLKSSAVKADIALTKMLRLLQITTGFMTDENQVIHTFDQTPRIKALEELIEDLAPNHKILIWSIFKQNYIQIKNVCEKLGVGYVEGHGEINSTNKFRNVDTFNNNQDCRIFIGHPSSVGLGINLCSASYSIVYSRSWSLEQDIQSEARNYRAGSEIHPKVTKIDLVAKDTIEDMILQLLERKINDANLIIGTIKDYIGG